MTSIVLAAAAEGVELVELQIQVESRSDLRGILGMIGGDGAPVPAQPESLRLRIRMAAHGLAPQQQRALIERALGRSPIPCAVAHAVRLALEIDIGSEA